MKLSCHLLLSTCLITTSGILGADEQINQDTLRGQSVLRTPVKSPQPKQAKTLASAQQRVDPNNQTFKGISNVNAAAQKIAPQPVSSAQKNGAPSNSGSGTLARNMPSEALEKVHPFGARGGG